MELDCLFIKYEQQDNKKNDSLLKIIVLKLNLNKEPKNSQVFIPVLEGEDERTLFTDWNSKTIQFF